MREAEGLEAATLVRRECLPGRREAAERRASGPELPRGLVGVMIATTLTTFATLSGSYTLLF